MLADPDPFGPAVAAPVRRRNEGETVVIPAQPGKPITVTLPYPISANAYWAHRIATAKSGRQMALTHVTHEARKYKKTVAWLLVAAGVRQPLQGRVQVDFQLWPHRPLDWAKRAKADPLYWADTVQRLDLDNCRKVVNDALKDIAFADDKCIWKDSGEVMEPDGRDACLVVTITPLVKVNPQEALL